MGGNAGVALVTGASAGIGQAIAAKLAQAGFRVFGTSRHPGASSTPGVEMLKLDVCDDSSVQACVAKVLSDTGRLDVLVNNAGIAMLGAIEESSSAQVQQMFETNVFGAMRMARAVLPAMRAARKGRIINISSVIGFLPGAHAGYYASTKYALEGFSDALDHEVRTFGIRSILIEPGFIRTSIGNHSLEPDAKLPVYDAARKNIAEVFGTELAKAPGPQLVADAVLAAIQNKNPRIRYPVGKDAKLLALMRRFMPASAFEKGFRKQFRLPPA
jgi:NAD(P)-dependent dehydrogenase (short-subunit alcohol dehydrogenase family)